MYDIVPGDDASAEKYEVDVFSVQIPDHADDPGCGIISSDRYAAEGESVYVEVASHDHTTEPGLSSAGVTFSDAQYPDPWFLKLHGLFSSVVFVVCIGDDAGLQVLFFLLKEPYASGFHMY